MTVEGDAEQVPHFTLEPVGRRPPHVTQDLQVTAEEFRQNVVRDRLSRPAGKT